MWKYLDICGRFLLVCDFICLCQGLRGLFILTTAASVADIASVTYAAIRISAICLFSCFVVIISNHLILCLLVHLAVLLKWIHDSHAFGKARLRHGVINLLFINSNRRDGRIVVMLLRQILLRVHVACL